MSQRGVERVIGRLATDEEFRRRFAENPAAILQEAIACGVELTSLEVQALASIDPAVRLGIDLSSLRTVEDCRRVLSTVLAAIARGEIAPAEGARIARRVRARLCAEPARAGGAANHRG